MATENTTYFWFTEQREKVVYYEHVISGDIIQYKERKFPGNYSGTRSVRIFLTPTKRYLANVDSEEFFIDEVEFPAMSGKEPREIISDANSSFIFFLVQEGDNFQFIYINTDTKKSGTISLVLPPDLAIGSVVTNNQTCGEENFLMVQDKQSFVVQIFDYSVSELFRAAEQGIESYTLNTTHSIDFKSWEKSLEINDCSMIKLRYPYDAKILIITLVNPSRWYIIIPNVTFAHHELPDCRLQDEKNGSRLAVCRQSSELQLVLMHPYEFGGTLGLAGILNESYGLIFGVYLVDVCNLMNDCYGCHLIYWSVFIRDTTCSWDGRKCGLSERYKPFDECITFPNIIANDGILEVHVKGVRLTNNFMRIGIWTPEDREIEPEIVEDFMAGFRVDNTLLEKWKTGEADLTFQVENDILNRSTVRLNLRASSDKPGSDVIMWILIILFSSVFTLSAVLAISRRKSSKYDEAPKPGESRMSSSPSPVKHSNLLGPLSSISLVKFFNRDHNPGAEPSVSLKVKDTIPKVEEVPIKSTT
ncbi:uncharacterized protein LOC141851613 [Brevipalpus obovatus]|uniref:uncharacterized protein LOC141851613 n=1 Tax=Brevipalpus obovatus TaxID=246614 RepID=UPI003D9EC69F